jgi:monofunctional biosynthetic peptidoglycan transglycosylase
MIREQLMAIESGALESGKGRRPRRRWVEWSDISPQIKVAVIAAEDQTFPTHHGFDLDSINEALEDRENGRRVRGASTISQQVAKNLFLWPGQSWVRKGLEAYFTVLIETLWPKRRILEVYLNIAEFGRGVFGVGAASEVYFGKRASQLNAPDAALLAAVLPSPKRMRVASPSPYVRSRQEWILRQMGGLGGVGLLQQMEKEKKKKKKRIADGG